MAEIRPFRAIQFRTPPIPIEKVVTQPYDKITPQMRERYLAAHPNNLVRILRPLDGRAPDGPAGEPDSSPYETAARTWRHWIRQGVLTTRPEPAVFAYYQRFRVPGSGEVLTRKGLVALTRLESYDRGVIFPHERTLSGPREDRLELLRQTRTHFGQVFLMYSDPDRRIDTLLDEAIAAGRSVEVEDEYAVIHRIWTLTSPELIRSVQNQMVSQKLVIADGHHRYETALAFRDEERSRTSRADAGGFEWLMTTLVNTESPGMVVLPTHRVLSHLPDFDVQRVLDRVRRYWSVTTTKDGETLLGELPESGRRHQSLGLAFPAGRCYLLTLREGVDPHTLLPEFSAGQASLDVVLLHRLLLREGLGLSEEAVRDERHIRYLRDGREALAAVADGGSQMACLLNPTPLDAVRAIALEGGVLPQKSTDFYPKLLSGLVMYCGDN
jgi:uncharacterized protein (DUF1015 family)